MIIEGPKNLLGGYGTPLGCFKYSRILVLVGLVAGRCGPVWADFVLFGPGRAHGGRDIGILGPKDCWLGPQTHPTI